MASIIEKQLEFLRGLISTNYFSAPIVSLGLGFVYCVAVGVSAYDIAHGGKITNPPQVLQVPRAPVSAPSKLEDLSLGK